jgi:hypothetical protein
MANKIKNESGFTGLEVLFVILIVLIIGVAGWLVYKDHHKTINSSSTSQDNGGKGGTAHPDTGPAKTEVFIIPEWKLSAEIPTPPTNAALIQYKITTVNSEAVANFTTQELIDSDKTNCTADNAPAGTITKALPTDPAYAPDGTPTGKTVTQEIQSTGGTYTKVGSYIYWYSHPQGVCSTAANGPQLQNDAIKQVQVIVSKLQAE